jgi:hypothetical protein
MAKLTAAQIKVQTKKILEAIEKEKRRVEGQKNLKFAALEPKDIERKLKRVKSPMIIAESWTNQAQPGGTIDYNVTIWNPDPTPFPLPERPHLGRIRQRRSGPRHVPAECRHALSTPDRAARCLNWCGVSFTPSSLSTVFSIARVIVACFLGLPSQVTKTASARLPVTAGAISLR